MDEKQNKSPVNIEMGASIKAEIKTQIPAKSSGKLIDALTDILRPFSERRGLKADQVRLQREDILIEIARRAQDRLAIENKHPSSISNKFMVPFLEKASCEDGDDNLIEMWANLLTAASTQYEEVQTTFVSILSDLGPIAAMHLRNLVCEAGGKEAILTIQNTPTNVWHDVLRSWLAKAVSGEVGFLVGHSQQTEIAASIVEKFNFKMSRLRHVEILDYIPGGYPQSHLTQAPDAMKYAKTASILYRLGLLEEHSVTFQVHERRNISLSVVGPTYLGIELILTCERLQ